MSIEKIESGDHSQFCIRLANSGLVSLEQAKVIVSTAKKYQYLDRLVELCLSDELLAVIGRVLPKESDYHSNLRHSLFISPNVLGVLERFAQDGFWEVFSEDDFSALDHQVVQVSPAGAFRCLIEIVEDERLVEWLGSRPMAVNFLNKMGSPVDVTNFLHGENLEYIKSNFSCEDFLDLKQFFMPSDLIKYPWICQRLANIKIDQGDWASGLYELNMLFYDLDLVGFDKKELERLMFGEYKKTLVLRVANRGALNSDEEENLESELDLLKRSSSSFVAKKQLEGSVRAGFADMRGGRKLLRNNVAKQERKDWDDKWKQRIDGLDIGWLESKDNPLRSLVPLIGYEIEFETELGVDKSPYSLAGKLGFKMGWGSGDTILEVSPGPFAHHRTAGLTFLSYLDSGLINTDGYFDQSVHLNLGLKGKVGAVALMRFLQLTGYAYNPLFVDQSTLKNYKQEGARHSLRIRRNDQGHGPYMECKEFSLMAPSDFLRFLRCSQMLGAGLVAWQDIFSFRYPDKNNWQSQLEILETYGDDYFRSDEYWDHSLEQKMKMVDDSSVSNIQKELARVYISACETMNKGLEQLNLSNFLTEGVEIAVSRVVVSEMHSIFPDVYSRMSADAIDQWTGTAMEYEDQFFPNVIAFARKTAMDATAKIEHLLEAQERAMAVDLGEAISSRKTEKVWEVIKKHKDMLGLEGLPTVEKRQKLLRMVRRYKSIGWI